MPPEYLIVFILATYRWTLMINAEKGMFDMFGRLRTLAGVKYDQYSNPYSTGWISEGILCPYCLSVWVGIGITALYVLGIALNGQSVVFYSMLPFALSGVTVYLKKVAG